MQLKKVEVLMSNEKVAYVLVDVKITNIENYEKYKSLAKPLLEKFGGDSVNQLKSHIDSSAKYWKKYF